jgi:hypothetical protein
MRTDNEKSSGPWAALVMASAAAVLSLVGVVDLARYVAELGPQVGDLISFTADRNAGDRVDSRLEFSRVDSSSCLLDIAMIRREGGSIVIEERQPGPPRVYRVHWSGTRGNPEDGACGVSADLLLKSADLDQLAVAAGGYGVDHRSLTPSSVWVKNSAGAQ